MTEIMAYLAYVPIAILGIFVLINLIKGLVRGTVKTLVTLGAAVLAAIIAFVVTVIVCKPGSGIVSSLYGLISGILPAEMMNEVGAELLGNSLPYYIAMLVAPFFFVAVYCIASLITAIVSGIIMKKKYTKQKEGKWSRVGGALIGIVCGLLVGMLVLTPIIGTLGIASTVCELDMAKDSLPEGVDEFLENDMITVLGSSGGYMLYDLLASTKYGDETVYLSNEVETIVAIINRLGVLEGDVAEYGQDQIDALESVVAELECSPMLRDILANLISSAASQWSTGESFMGMAKPDTGELISPIVDGMLGVLATSTKDNIGQDLETLTDVFSIMIRNKILMYSSNPEAMLNQLTKTNAISELIEVINANERMRVLSDEITSLSIRALASSIGVPADEQERYDLLMSEIARIVSASYGISNEERGFVMRPELAKAFEKYGVEIGGEALANLCEGLVADLGHKAVVDASDVKEFFTIYAIASTESMCRGCVGYDLLEAGSAVPELVINTDGTISVSGVVFSNYYADSFRGSAAYGMAMSGISFEGAASLYSARAMESTLVTAADLLAAVGKYSDCADVLAESRKVGEIISYALDVFNNTDFANVSASELMPELGKVLDMMNSSEIFGYDLASGLLMAMLQSEKVVGTLGISAKECTAFANKINEMVAGESFDYLHATEIISNTIAVIESTGNTDKTKEEKIEDAQKLLESISKESAEMIGTLVTPSLVESYGVSGSTSETVSATVNSLLDNMANYENDNDESGELAAKEAEAVSTLLDLAITASSSQGALFNEEDSAGALDTSAEEFIDLVITSDVVYGTIDDMVYRDGNTDNPLGANLSAADSAQVVDALESYYESNGGGDELARKLEAIAIMLNVNVELDK